MESIDKLRASSDDEIRNYFDWNEEWHYGQGQRDIINRLLDVANRHHAESTVVAFLEEVVGRIETDIKMEKK